jgi:hypothetical protein
VTEKEHGNETLKIIGDIFNEIHRHIEYILFQIAVLMGYLPNLSNI